jgi:hypothetical protein
MRNWPFEGQLRIAPTVGCNGSTAKRKRDDARSLVKLTNKT